MTLETPGSGRPHRSMRRRQAGFTLLELMVTAAIIGIIVALAVPNFRGIAYTARRAEGYTGLRTIFQLQTDFFTEAGRYSNSLAELAFDIENGIMLPGATSYQGAWYTYTLQTRPLAGVPQANYRATATGDIDPRDLVLDIIVSENQLTVIAPPAPNRLVDAGQPIITSNDITNLIINVVSSP